MTIILNTFYSEDGINLLNKDEVKYLIMKMEAEWYDALRFNVFELSKATYCYKKTFFFTLQITYTFNIFNSF